jgi:hypothetical protein
VSVRQQKKYEKVGHPPLTAYVNGQSTIVGQRHNQDEKLAYAVSDPIAPQYVYQNCGQY